MIACRLTSIVPRGVALVLAGVTSAFCLLALAPGIASAVETRSLEASFGPDGTAATHFEHPAAVGIDESTGAVYVADVAAGAIEKFNSEHKPEMFTGISPNISGNELTGFSLRASDEGELAVNSASHDFYVVDNGTNRVLAFQSDGEPVDFTQGPNAGINEISGLGEPCGVAVDSHGDIYAGDYVSGVHIYAENGEPLATISVPGVCNITVDPQGNLYLNYFYGRGSVEKLTPSTFPVTSSTTYKADGIVDANTAWGVAVDPVTDDLFVDEHNRVAEYDEGGFRLLTFGSFELGALTASEGLAFDTFSGADKIYVSDAEGKRQVEIFGPPVVIPDVTTSPVSNPGLRGATLEGTVDPDEAGAATCQFEWGTSESFGHIAPCSEAVANGHSPMTVHAEVTGLQLNTTYYYRLRASNENGTNPGEASQDHQFRTLGPPVVQEASASGVTSTSATINAEIDPNNSPTRYYFEYGTTAAYGSSVPALPGAGVGFGEGFVDVSVHLQGLAPGTTYRYRVVAVNEPEGERFIAEGPDEMFTTQSAATGVALPDGRQWEMVTPPNKHGASLYGVGGGSDGSDIQAAAEGGAITYTSTAPLVANPAGSRTLEVEQSLSTREAPGSWGTVDVETPHDHGPIAPAPGGWPEYRLFSSDLSLGFLKPSYDGPLPPLPASAEKTIYIREADGAYKALVTSANVPPGTEFGHPRGVNASEEPYGDMAIKFVSASPDLSHVVISSEVALEEGAPAEGGLYEWADGKLQLVSVLPKKGEATSQATLGYSPYSSNESAVRHAISNDGSRIVWEDDENGSLYLRDTVRGETVQIDAAQGAPELSSHQSSYWTANGEGSRVFFTNPERLTADSTAPEGGSSAGDLYVFEVTSGAGERLAGRLTDLTVDSHAGETASVQGVIGASEDGSYVYFVAEGMLGGATKVGKNLYVDHYEEATKTWSAPTLIATLSDLDAPTWGGRVGVFDVESVRDLKWMTSRVSPNGRYLAFMSEESLTGYENRDAITGKRDQEVFLYDASSGRLVCASCDPTGERPLGVAYSAEEYPPLRDAGNVWAGAGLSNASVAANIPGWTTEAYGTLIQSRYLSDSGRLFFNSSDALVPSDVNGQVDVYEYEPAGEHACSPASTSGSLVYSPSAEGCIGLISAGTSSQESAFLEASETGGDVFFLTTSQLSPQDYDQSYDIYDAHECAAASPCAPPSPLSRPPCTTGDACKAAPTPQPTLYGAPSSETFSGAGNVTPTPAVEPKAKPVKCRRGDVKRHGVCVKKRSRKAVKSKRARKTNRRGK